MRAIILAGLVAVGGSFSVQAEERDPCADAVLNARQYINEEKLNKVVSAQWQIITSDKANDIEKLASLVVFVTYQRAAYDWRKIKSKFGGAEGWDSHMYQTCSEMVTNYNVVEMNTAPASNEPETSYEDIY